MKKILLVSFLLSALVSFAQKTATGVITNVKGKNVTIKMDRQEVLPAKNDSCSISKDISGTTNPFGIKVSSGWLGVGNLLVTGVDKANVSGKIVKETSEIIINGKKTEHFVPGKKVKLEWK